MGEPMVEVVFDQTDVDDLRNRLGVLADKINDVQRGALSDTTKQARTFVKKEVKKVIPYSAKFLSDAVKMRLPNRRRLIGTLTWSSPRPTLTALGTFKPKSNRRSKKNKRGKLSKPPTPVSYQIEKTGPWRNLPDAFVARFPQRKLGLFKRKGEKRLPIRMPRGPSIAPVIEKHGIDDATRVFVRAKLKERLEDRANLLVERTFGA